MTFGLKRHLKCVVISFVAMTASGCADEFSNAIFDDDARFVAAAPRGSELRIGGAVNVTSATAGVNMIEVGDWAETYVLTRQVTLQLNALALGVLYDVDSLLIAPPDVRDADRRVWRPRPHALAPAEASFEVVEVEPGHFTYGLLQRRRALDDTFTSVMEGAFVAEGPDAGTGRFVLDVSRQSALAGGGAHGEISVDYVVAGAGLSLWISLVDYAYGDDVPIDATYHFERSDEGAGTFDFAFPDEEGALVEMRSRWSVEGAGRADVRVTGDGVQVFSECWGVNFQQVFAQAGAARVGDVEACAFSQASLP